MMSENLRLKNIICEKSACTGCGACALSCLARSIAMVEDSEGFLYPKIDTSTCTSCEKCSAICPANRKTEMNVIPDVREIYAGSDESVASLEGISNVLIGWIEENGGVNLDFCEAENSYISVKDHLDSEIPVLFKGKPCQVDGLKAFLEKDYENLFTRDSVCSGVTSEKVRQVFGEDLPQHKSINTLCLRASCYNCVYNRFTRQSDLTFGEGPLVLINTYKGEKTIAAIKPRIINLYASSSKSTALDNNVPVPLLTSRRRKAFFGDLENLSSEQLNRKYAKTANPLEKSLALIINRFRQGLKYYSFFTLISKTLLGICRSIHSRYKKRKEIKLNQKFRKAAETKNEEFLEIIRSMDVE